MPLASMWPRSSRLHPTHTLGRSSGFGTPNRACLRLLYVSRPYRKRMRAPVYISEVSMTMKNVAFVLGSMAMLFTLTGSTCGGEDACVAAKQHMCANIPGQNCDAAYMGNAQKKIMDACGQAELDAYIPAVQNACSAATSSGVAMDCSGIAGKTYAGPQADAGG